MRFKVKRDWLNTSTRSPSAIDSSKIQKSTSIFAEFSIDPGI
jgi:hypothetical protein